MSHDVKAVMFPDYPNERERAAIARGLWPVRTLTRAQAEALYPSAPPRYIPPAYEPCPPLFYPDMHGKHKTDHGSAHTSVWWHWCPWHGGVYLCPDLFDPKLFYTPGCKFVWVFQCTACASGLPQGEE